MRKHSALFIFCNRYMSASAISFGGCVRFMMTVYVTVFNIIAAAFKTFPEN